MLGENKIKMSRKPGKTQTENPVGCTGEGKISKENIREGSRGNGNRLGIEFGGEVTHAKRLVNDT